MCLGSFPGIIQGNEKNGGKWRAGVWQSIPGKGSRTVVEEIQMYQMREMTLFYANEIANWKYADEYSLYSFRQDEETMDELMSGQYFACVKSKCTDASSVHRESVRGGLELFSGQSGKEELAGYFCFGKAAQIPVKEAEIYQDSFMDIGLGLRPDLCGRGLGEGFMRAGIAYANAVFHPPCLRLTVACFNKRAIRLYQRTGFKIVREITHKKTGRDFYLMQRLQER